MLGVLKIMIKYKKTMKKSLKMTVVTVLSMLCACVSAQSVSQITDCQGHTYPVVKIGSQYWMAENLRCTKYDTKSERAGQTLQLSSDYIEENLDEFLILSLTGSSHYFFYTPYYTDGRDATSEYSGNLTSTQRQHLGLLYNWTAAMGYKNMSEAKEQTGTYTGGKRQGICPNGWHLPNREDWNTLAKALGGVSKTDSDGDVYYSNVGAKLKSKNSWYNGGNGTDNYGFSGLPAGYADGDDVKDVGEWGFFWSSDAGNSEGAYIRILDFSVSSLYELGVAKYSAGSVRCVKN